MVLKHLEVYLGPFQQMIKLFAKIFFAKITPPQIFDRVPDIVLTLLKVNSKRFPRNCSDLLRNVCQVSILEHLLNHFSKFTFPLTFSLKNHCFYTAQKIKFSIKDFFSKCVSSLIVFTSSDFFCLLNLFLFHFLLFNAFSLLVYIFLYECKQLYK